MDSSEIAGHHQGDRGSDEGTWRDDLASLLRPTTVPRTSQDATVNLLRAARRPPAALAAERGIASIDAQSNRQPQHPVDVSLTTAKDRDDILLQQVTDDRATSARERQHQHLVFELAERIAEHTLPAKPRPWLTAVAAEAITGNADVVTALTAGLRRATTDHRPLW